MNQDDIEYYRKRLDQERTLEACSESNDVRQVHAQLAELYARRLAALRKI